jgi:hypothetical protein
MVGFPSFCQDLLARIGSQLFAVAMGGIWKSERNSRVQIDLRIIEFGLDPVSERWDERRFVIEIRFKCGFKDTVVGWVGRVPFKF